MAMARLTTLFFERKIFPEQPIRALPNKLNQYESVVSILFIINIF